jgi:tryptophan synthase alpha chain
MIDIKSVFERGNKKAFVGFITAGDPTLEDTKRYLEVMQTSGVDIIEVGIPFSDPIAEGVVIQEADIRALKNDVCLDEIFKMVAGIEKKVPFLFMTYANPVFFYGYERFFERCKEVGVSGVIIPDIPYEESDEVKCVAVKYGVAVIDMVAPTSEERIKKVCVQSKGFIYLVSSLGVTGVRKQISTDISSIYRQIRAVTDTPVCVGFGISTPEQAVKMAGDTDGAIIGSAIVRIIAQYGSHADEQLRDYLTSVACAVHEI